MTQGVGMKVSGQYADYRGREYDVVAVAPPTVLLRVDEGSASLPDELERGSHWATWARIPIAATTRVFRRSVSATWRGEEVSVMGVDGDRAGVAYLGDPWFAEENGLEGSQHDGWSGWAPVAELSDVREEVKELAL